MLLEGCIYACLIQLHFCRKYDGCNYIVVGNMMDSTAYYFDSVDDDVALFFDPLSCRRLFSLL